MRPVISGAFLYRSSGSHDADLATIDVLCCWGQRQGEGRGGLWAIRKRAGAQPFAPRDATGDTTECIWLYITRTSVVVSLNVGKSDIGRVLVVV